MIIFTFYEIFNSGKAASQLSAFTDEAKHANKCSELKAPQTCRVLEASKIVPV